jgi:integrase
MPSNQGIKRRNMAKNQEKVNLLGISGVSAYFRLCRARHKRKTFGSLLAQNGVSTAVTQRLLEHSSPNLTNKVYTNVDPALRHAVEQLMVDKWL